MGINNGPANSFNAGLNCGAFTKMMAAPKDAPALVPINPGYTMGLRNNPCISTPLTARIAPVIEQSMTLGNRS